MLKRLLENWLDNVNERNYQPVFLQILIKKGYTVVHNTRHHPLEFGKDVITIAPDGVPCVYQLKGNPSGRVNLKQYREEIAAQVHEMVNLSLKSHVGIDKSHRCFFVTNGEVDEDVRRLISDLNIEISKNIGPERVVQIVARGQFLQDLVELEESLWPKEISDMRLLMETMSVEGNNLFPSEKLDYLLRDMLFLNDNATKPTQKQLKRNIGSAGLLVALCLSDFSKKNNYYAATTAWTIYASYVIASCEKYGFRLVKVGEESVKIANDVIADNLISLFEEVIKKSPRLYEGSGFAEFAVYKYRYTLLVGLMSLLWLQKEQANVNLNDEQTCQLETFLNSVSNDIYLFGEGAVPQHLFYYWYLIGNNKKEKAQEYLQKLMREICGRKLSDNPKSLVDAYWSIEDVVKHDFSMVLDTIESPLKNYDFSHSHFSKPLFHLMVLAGMKSGCQEFWSDYSEIIFNEFIPLKPHSFCLLRNEDGDNNSESVPLVGEWDEISAEAHKISLNLLPKAMQENQYILAMFLIIFPYRAGTDVIKYLNSLFYK